jgi:hypothetical protein
MNKNMRSEVDKEVKMLIVVFWAVIPCRLVGGHQHFREKDCLNRLGRLYQPFGETFHLHLFRTDNPVTTQKTTINNEEKVSEFSFEAYFGYKIFSKISLHGVTVATKLP